MAEQWKPGDVLTNPSGGRWIVQETWENDQIELYVASTMKCDPLPLSMVVGPRRLVVIDPEDREQVERLTEALWPRYNAATLEKVKQALREFASPTPPKPEEPTGLGAVVEDAAGVKWVRFKSWEQTPWRQGHMPGGDTEAVSAYYRDIDVVRVLSEGVQP